MTELFNQTLEKISIAIEKNDVINVKKLIELNPKVFANAIISDSKNWTPLIKACNLGRVNIVKMMLNDPGWNVKLDHCGFDGKVALEHSFEQKQHSCALLIANKVSGLNLAKTSMSVIKKIAEEGNVEVQNYLGVLYHKGPDDVKDYKAAKHWYEKAAEQGNNNSMSDKRAILL